MAKKKERKVPEVLVFTDTNRHIDDLASLAILAYLNDKRLINLRGIITQVGTFETRRRRAMFAKGAMSYLGYPFIKAVPGGDYETLEGDENSTYIETPFTPIFKYVFPSERRAPCTAWGSGAKATWKSLKGCSTSSGPTRIMVAAG